MEEVLNEIWELINRMPADRREEKEERDDQREKKRCREEEKSKRINYTF